MDWYAVYTKKFSEEKLKNYFLNFSNNNELGYECYLPMISEVRSWSDRKKVKRVPLFRNYLFVRHDVSGFQNLIKMPGFLDYVRFGKYPEKIQDDQIDLIRRAMEVDSGITCCDFKLVKGDRVRVKTGPLKDVEGVLVKDQENSKIAIEIKGINQCMQLSLSVDNAIKV